MGEPRFFANDEVVLITGGASGLGETLVRMFVAEGARVAFTYRNSQDKAEDLKRQLGERVVGVKADASDYRLAQSVVLDIKEAFGKIDVLVNNAASARYGAFLNLDIEDMRFTLENTFLPVFNYTQAAGRIMVEQRGGAIVQIGSINGERGREGSAPYSAAKAALEGLSKTVARELGRFGVRCNVVSPGYIATEGQRNTSPLIQKMVLDECAIPQLAEPEDIASLVLFLASDMAKAITGQIYRVDYGQYI